MIFDGLKMRELALRQKGKPYVFAAEVKYDDPDPDKFDCSELTSWLYNYLWKLPLPDGSGAQYDASERLDKNTALRIGDLGFHKDTYKPGISDVCMYIGQDQVIWAKGKNYGVVVATVKSYSSSSHFAGWRRPKLVKNITITEKAPGLPDPNFWKIYAGPVPVNQAETGLNADLLTDAYVVRYSKKNPDIKVQAFDQNNKPRYKNGNNLYQVLMEMGVPTDKISQVIAWIKGV